MQCSNVIYKVTGILNLKILQFFPVLSSKNSFIIKNVLVEVLVLNMKNIRKLV